MVAGASHSRVARGLVPAAMLGVLFSCQVQEPDDGEGDGLDGLGGAGAGVPVAGAGAGGAGGAGAPSAGQGGAAGTIAVGGADAGAGGAGVGGTGGAGAGGSSGAGAAGAGAGGSSGAGAGGSSGAGAGGSAGSAGGAGSGVGFSPCPMGEPCKILPLGDSITVGLGAPGGGGYRVPLFQKTLEAGQSVTFVGSQSGGPSMVDGAPFSNSHEGHSGRTIDFIAGRLPDPALDDGAHVILLMIGTNDMYMQPTGAADRLAELLDEILMLVPDALLVVAQLTPFPAQDTNVKAYNAAIPPLVQARASAGKHVVLVDMYTDFDASLIGDGVHPNAEGYELMAERWYEAIGEVLPASP